MRKVMVMVAVALAAATMSACSAEPKVIAPGQSASFAASAAVNGEGA